MTLASFEELTHRALKVFLTEDILERFDIADVQEHEGRAIFSLKEKYLPPKIKNIEIESKGFFPEITIQDFPVRGQPTYLKIKRRRWRNVVTKKEIPQPWNGVAGGTSYTKEFGDFLKDMDREGTNGNQSNSQAYLRGHEEIRKALQRSSK